jgi:hypothetical protein
MYADRADRKEGGRKEGVMRCERCGKKALSLTGSYFNTQMICPDCDDRERKHPRFKDAVAADEAACRQGNYNYSGIGLPEDIDSTK